MQKFLPARKATRRDGPIKSFDYNGKMCLRLRETEIGRERGRERCVYFVIMFLLCFSLGQEMRNVCACEHKSDADSVFSLREVRNCEESLEN